MLHLMNLAILILGAFDLISTYFLTSIDFGTELNPMMGALLGTPWFVPIKITFHVAFYMGYTWLIIDNKHYPDRTFRIALIGGLLSVFLLYTYIAYNNGRILLDWWNWSGLILKGGTL